MNEPQRPIRNIKAAPSAATSLTQAGPKPLKVVLAVLAVCVLLISGVGWYAVGRVGNDVANAGNLALGGGKGSRGHAADGATDILLVGSDSRTDAQGNQLTPEEIDMLHAGDEEADNTDTMMVIRVPNDGSSATAVSIPRDTYIKDGENGNMKINGVYAAHKASEAEHLRAEAAQGGQHLSDAEIEERSKVAGRKALIQAVANLTGVEVDHYAEVGLVGFVLLTDAVGGVDVCLNAPVNDEFSGANFPAGQQTLNGPQALAFVRQRHGLPRGDLDRIVRQQAYMASLVNKVLAAGTLTNPSKLSDMGQAVQRSVVLDDGWDIISFATQLQDLAGGNVVFNTIPVTSLDGVGDYGESIVTVNVDEVHRFMKNLLGDKNDPNNDNTESSSTTAQPAEKFSDAVKTSQVHVLNAGSTPGLAGAIAKVLKDDGLKVVETGNSRPGVYSTSQILVAPGSEDAGHELANALGGLEVKENSSLEPGTIIVVAHNDYHGPHGDLQESAAEEKSVVGQPGSDMGELPESPKIDAGGNGPRCVN
ncbi:LytR family transcriptional regulator [Corynebacterium poyangense]|uniref:LytR family transcriptional regulator n=1 Tax=Corynebacterium poyangense TaxID=2684405 RepID=A0A7H0SMI1_9CORY|nr:LCP family protein [Corynebacterium poyangense]QNQ89756.1 LytR family transcriptional regulator [Corynebacterium poyangense]